ncbi:YfaZ family outer membrane protein [Dyella sp. A6]|uniref:YfaZ family outer membrane protein n=1 Tax=Dyella aluminiiresistens TaxID=3069105 RepID=UPI002E776D7A|nr:YfaZ family outer membrane protein [Dyella sp. A6]
MTRVLLVCSLLASILAFVPAARATSVALGGGDGSFAVHADTALLPTLHADLDYLRTGSGHGNADIYGIGLMVSPPTPLVHWAIGARYQYQSTRYGNGGGVELGASLFFDTPLPLLRVGGYGFYMPSGAASGDIRHSADYGAQLRLGLTRSIYAYAGYRYLRTAFDGTGTHVVYRGPAIGVSVGF